MRCPCDRGFISSRRGLIPSFENIPAVQKPKLIEEIEKNILKLVKMERNQSKNEAREDDDDVAMKRAMNMTVPERIGKLVCRF